jgi:hypothetical protein
MSEYQQLKGALPHWIKWYLYMQKELIISQIINALHTTIIS